MITMTYKSIFVKRDKRFNLIFNPLNIKKRNSLKNNKKNQFMSIRVSMTNL
jgi:hypothetical protein